MAAADKCGARHSAELDARFTAQRRQYFGRGQKQNRSGSHGGVESAVLIQGMARARQATAERVSYVNPRAVYRPLWATEIDR